jgi:IclR family mhp operon transcriptional activator
MAVAILTGGAPIATLNLTWPAKRGTDEAVMHRHLDALHQTAQAIGRAVATQSVGLASAGTSA